MMYDATQFGPLIPTDQAAAPANRTTIQTAIDYASQHGGGSVLIPGDLFYVTGTSGQQCFLMRDGVTIRGTNRYKTILKLKDGASAHIFGSYANTLDHAGLTDLTLDGNKANQDATIHVAGCRNVGGVGLRFERLIIQHCTHYGLSFTGGDADQALRDSLVFDCIIRDNGDPVQLGDGIDCKAAQRCTFRDLELSGNAETGMDMRLQHCVISGVRAHGNLLSGIQVRGAATDPKLVPNLMSVSDCFAYDNGKHGIVVSSDEGRRGIDRCHISITNCHAYANAESGFYLIGRNAWVPYTGCHALNNGRWGWEQATTDATACVPTLLNCVTDGNGLGASVDARVA